MQFGAVLRKMRKKADMSQEDMAEALSISRSNVSRLEADRLELKAADMVRWCEVTQMHEVMIAFTYGADGLSIMQQLINSGMTMIGTMM